MKVSVDFFNELTESSLSLASIELAGNSSDKTYNRSKKVFLQRLYLFHNHL